MLTIVSLTPRPDWKLEVAVGDGSRSVFDVKPLLSCEAFRELQDPALFRQARNRGTFVEWVNGADLSADTLKLAGSPAREPADGVALPASVSGAP